MSVDLTTSLLSLSGGLTSDFISDLPTWAPFADGGLGSTTDDSFYLAETLPFVEDEPLATVIEDDPFELAGFEGNPGTSDLFTGEFDIA